jgi:hypothetical protein
MRVHVAACSLKPHDIELPAQPLAIADTLVKRAPAPAILGGNQVERTAALHGLGITGLHHIQAGRVHVQKRAVASDDLNAFRRRLEDCVQPILGFPTLPSDPRHFEIGGDARKELARAERFDKVVVGAGVESFDACLLSRTRRQQHHRQIGERGV